MKNLFNILQILGWGYVLVSIFQEIAANPSSVTHFNPGNNLATALLVMRVVQSLQIFDFVLSSGNIISVLAQYVGRMVVGWMHFNEQTSTLSLICALIPWSFADIIRYSFYLNKNDITSFFRFNAFMILYPIGVFLGEIPSIQQYINNLPTDTEYYDALIYFARVVQVGVFIGMPVLASYLFKSRKNYYKKKASGSAHEDDSKKQAKSKKTDKKSN